MKPNESSQDALLVAQQKVDRQVLEHAQFSLPFATKILRKNAREALQFAPLHPFTA